MNLDIVKSVNGVPIRLTFERWYEHILVRHPFMSGIMRLFWTQSKIPNLFYADTKARELRF